MDVRPLLTASLLGGISGCATVGDFAHDHPAAVAAGVILVMGSIEASQSHHTHVPARSDAGSCVTIVQTILGPQPVPCH